MRGSATEMPRRVVQGSCDLTKGAVMTYLPYAFLSVMGGLSLATFLTSATLCL